MGLGAIGGFIVKTVEYYAVSYLLGRMFKKTPKGPTMQPATLDSFGISKAEEGSVVLWHLGRIRTPGNVIWYGNLKTVEHKEKAEGGKGGGGSKSQVVGY